MSEALYPLIQYKEREGMKKYIVEEAISVTSLNHRIWVMKDHFINKKTEN